MASVAAPTGASHPAYNYDRPMVSFVTPVGPGHEKLVGDAIESIAAQLDHRWEHIIVDDTEEGKLQGYGVVPYAVRYPYLRWVRNPVLHNVSAARNAGAGLARGRFLCFLDADDMLFKEFLTETLPAALEAPRAMIYTDWMELPKVERHVAEPWDSKRLLEQALFAVTFLHTKEAFISVGGFDESIDVWEDWDYAIRLSLLGYVGVHVRKPLLSYRYHTGKRREESLAKAHERMRLSGLKTLAPPVKVVETSRAPTVLAAKANGGVKVRYIGDFQGTRLFRASKSHRKYRFGPGVHEVQSVHPEDLDFFRGLQGMFEIYTEGAA